MEILKMPPFCRVSLLTGDEHAHSFCRCVGFTAKMRSMQKVFVNDFFARKEKKKSSETRNLVI